MAERFELVPRGPFSLRAAAAFGFGPTEGRRPEWDGAMRLAFPLDGGRGYAGAVLRQQREDGPVEVSLQLTEGGDPQTALSQAARVVSLDHDGEAFQRVGRRDRVIGALQRAHHGQRPVLFHSPYEAAAWSIISARRRARQAAAMQTALSERLGETFDLAGGTVHAFPQPERLLEAPEDQLEALGAAKVERLRTVAEAASDGLLDVRRLHELGPEAAYEDVQQLKGIGPFYAGLVVLRATGFADALMSAPEPKVLAHAARFYGLAETPTLEHFRELAERWRPFRTWAMVLIRLAGDRGTTAAA